MSLDFVLSHITLDENIRLSDVIEEWQREIYQALLSERYKNAYVELPRNHNKTGLCEDLAICGLFLGPKRWRGYGVAVDKDQAAIMLSGIIEKIQRSDRLRSIARWTQSEVIIEETDSVFKILPSDAPSAYGLRPDLIICDELSSWRRRGMWDSMWTATGKKKNCRLIAITTAGWDRTSIAYEVRKIAESEDDWYFCSKGQVAGWISPRWLKSQEGSLPRHVFERLHSNRWVDNVGAFLTSDEVERVFSEVPDEQEGTYSIGVDIGIVKDRCAAAVVQRVGPFVVVRHLIHWKPRLLQRRVFLPEVKEDIADLCNRFQCGASIDQYQAVEMAQDLSAGYAVPVRDVPFTGDRRQKLFNKLLNLIRENKLRSIRHDELQKELLGLEVIDKGGGLWKVDHRPGKHDDFTIAVALALDNLPGEVVGETMPHAFGYRETAYLNRGRDWPMMPSPSEGPTGVSGQGMGPGIDWDSVRW